MAEIKNMQSNYDIENQKQINEIDSLQKLVNSLDEKFKFMIKEDRKKDEFLVNYLKGKTHDPNDKELVVNFFKQFEEVPKITMSELMRQ
jgi:Fe-S oxidoreductase